MVTPGWLRSGKICCDVVIAQSINIISPLPLTSPSLDPTLHCKAIHCTAVDIRDTLKQEKNLLKVFLVDFWDIFLTLRRLNDLI